MTSIITAIWGKSHVGYKRKKNEDRFLIKKLPGMTLFAVADGVAGNAGGALAAQIVINSIQECRFFNKNLEKDLSAAIAAAEKQIHLEVLKNPRLEGMGTTVTAAVSYKNKIHWAHVGDSRMYLLHHLKFRQITTDHTFIQEFIDDGVLTPAQAKTHPLRNMLEQCVGCGETEPDCGHLTIEKNDRLLLCSDGLTRHLSDLQIKTILQTKSVQEAGQKLIQTALEMGGTDNVTVIVKNCMTRM